MTAKACNNWTLCVRKVCGRLKILTQSSKLRELVLFRDIFSVDENCSRRQSVKSSDVNSRERIEKKRGYESSLAQYWTKRTSSRVDVRSWPGSRRLAAARKLASSSQSAWLGASSLLRGLETPKRTHRRVAQPSQREGFFCDSCRWGKRCQIFGSLRRLKAAQGAFDFCRLREIDARRTEMETFLKPMLSRGSRFQ